MEASARDYERPKTPKKVFSTHGKDFHRQCLAPHEPAAQDVNHIHQPFRHSIMLPEDRKEQQPCVSSDGLFTADRTIMTIGVVSLRLISLSSRRYVKGVSDFLSANRLAGRYLLKSPVFARSSAGMDGLPPGILTERDAAIEAILSEPSSPWPIRMP